MADVQKIHTTQEFRDCLTAAMAADRLVAIDFTAEWCGPCKIIGPRFEAMASEYKDVTFVKVDVDEVKEVASHCQISSMPTFQFWRDCNCLDKFSGADEGRLRSMIEALRFGAVVIKPETSVVIRGLQSDSAKEHNGKSGLVKSYDKQKGRYVIQIDDAISLALKPTNFTQRLEVMLSHMSDASMNGEAGQIVGYDADTEAYKVLLPDQGDDAEPIDAARENVVLPPLTVVVVLGLVSAAQHNGKWAKVLSYDPGSGRYLTQIDASTQLKLKRQNVSVAALP
jgi:thioredoxin